MKKIFLSMLVIALMSGSAFATNDNGGKKKAKQKAKTECKAEKCDPKCCDPQNCDPTNCDPAKCSSKCADMASASKQTTCAPASCSGTK
jgi:hypothetical protein